MKTYRKIAATLAAVASILMMPGANARHLGVDHDDGIAASPKVRQSFNESEVICAYDMNTDTIDRTSSRAASPKAQAFLASFERTPGVQLGEDTVNRSQMAMSPKVHQFLTERGWHPVSTEFQNEIVSLESEPMIESESPVDTDPDNPDYFNPDMPDNPDTPVNPDYPDNSNPDSDFNRDYDKPDFKSPDEESTDLDEPPYDDLDDDTDNSDMDEPPFDDLDDDTSSDYSQPDDLD
jgi:hypothetical protein